MKQSVIRGIISQMVQYRRSQVTGGTFFFTVNLRDRSTTHLVDYIAELRQSIRYVKQRQTFAIIAMVVLPDHLHAVIRLPEGDNDYPGRWRAIKSHFSRSLMKLGVDLKKNVKGEVNLWQRRYWEHQIRDARDLQVHVDYIHFNPMKHGYVTCVADWPYSSFHRYVRLELLSPDWGGLDVFGGEGYGERAG